MSACTRMRAAGTPPEHGSQRGPHPPLTLVPSLGPTPNPCSYPEWRQAGVSKGQALGHEPRSVKGLRSMTKTAFWPKVVQVLSRLTHWAWFAKWAPHTLLCNLIMSVRVLPKMAPKTARLPLLEFSVVLGPQRARIFLQAPGLHPTRRVQKQSKMAAGGGADCPSECPKGRHLGPEGTCGLHAPP